MRQSVDWHLLAIKDALSIKFVYIGLYAAIQVIIFLKDTPAK